MNDSSKHDEPLTEYLARLQVGLLGLPAKERDEAYRELAQHVESLVDQAAAAGGDKQETVRAALAKFGDPKEIGEALVYRRWAEVFAKMEPRRRIRRRWIVPEQLLPIAGGLYAVASVLLERAFHFRGLPLIIFAVLWGAVFGVVTGWYWAQRAQRGDVKEQRGWERVGVFLIGHPIPAGVLAARIAAALVLGVAIALVGYVSSSSNHGPFGLPALPAADRRDIENLYLFVAIMLASNIAIGKLVERALLARRRKAPSL